MPPPQSVAEIIQRFLDVTQNKLIEVTNEKRHKVYSNSETVEDFREELHLLKPHTKPILWGIGTALTLFASFRFSKFTGALRVKRRYGYGVGYEFENLKKGSSVGKNSNDATKQQMSNLASIPADLFLSTVVGLSATMFLTEVDKLQKDLASLPLIKGRSLIAEELCEDFIKEYKEIPEEVLNTDEALQSDSLRNIKMFVDNCQTRK